MYNLEIKGKEVHPVNTWQNSTEKDCMALGLTHPFVPAQVSGGGCYTLAA